MQNIFKNVFRINPTSLSVLVFSIVFFLNLVLIPIISMAQFDPPTSTSESPSAGSGDIKLENPISADSINGLIRDILVGVIKIGLPLVAIAIIYSGFLYVTALGNPGKIEKANSSLLYSVIGAGILLGAWAIAQLISDTVLSL